MTSKIQSQNINQELTNSTINVNDKNVLNYLTSNTNSKKNINENEDKENIKSFNNAKSFDIRNDSDSTLVKSNNNHSEQDKTLKYQSSNENNRSSCTIYENEIYNTNENEIENNSIIQDVLLKQNSTSSFKTAVSSSSKSSEDTFQTSKSEETNRNQKQNQNQSITSPQTKNINLQNENPILIKKENSVKASSSTTKINNSKSMDSNKSNRIQRYNASTTSLSKREKSKNSSKEYIATSQFTPNHLMLSENSSKTSLKKEEVSQKLSISSLTIKKAHSLKKQSKAIENIIGTPIKKDHVHYILMLDMLNGIRYSVQRCNASTNRELYLKDFKAKHKIALDVYNNELLPSSKYYYKFKDYAPRVFRSIREIFKISSEDYLMSLTGKYMLTEMDSPGKSGSFFYYSQDYRYIIKTVHHSEHKYLLKILKNYYMYLKRNPNTLICKIFGLHRVKIQHGKKIHFIVMENIFPPDKDIHEKYDLKGSLVGRYTNEKEQNPNKLLVLKDLNWLKKERKIYLGNEKKNILLNQLEKDVSFLAENDVMDYSLLVGCHNLNKGNKDNIRDSTLSIIEPSRESLSKNIDSKRKSKKDPMAMALARAMAETEPVSLETSSSTLPETIPKGKKHFIFYRDDGGFRATDENNNELQELYFLGIIDIFTNYNSKKRMEHLIKSVISDRKNISPVNPIFYAKRFLIFVNNSIGHDSKVNRLRNLKSNPKQNDNNSKISQNKQNTV